MKIRTRMDMEEDNKGDRPISACQVRTKHIQFPLSGLLP